MFGFTEGATGIHCDIRVETLANSGHGWECSADFKRKTCKNQFSAASRFDSARDARIIEGMRANARLWIIRAERTKEGDQLRRIYELKLDRSDPMFALSWMLFHVIDKDSPLHGLTASELTAGDAILVLNIGGVDDSSAQQLYARHVYSWSDIRWQHRYKDITSVSSHGAGAPRRGCASPHFDYVSRSVPSTAGHPFSKSPSC